ncbi:MAG: hypothetical protein MJ129_02100 [Clostridia bacterium]|nr:hypothetical protein [Clostridia bacterium]
MKLNKKLTSILVTGAMIASIGGTTAMTSFAEEPATPTPKVTAIKKVFQMPEGTQSPNATFHFNVTAVEGYGSNAALKADEVAKLSQTISYAPGDELGADAETDEGITTITKTSGALFDDEIEWPAAGQYAFRVVEQETGKVGDYKYNIDGDAYTMYVTVARDANGDLYVKNIVTIKTADEEEGKDAPKVDTGTPIVDEEPTDGVDDRTPGEDKIDSEIPSNVAFTNQYVESTNVTPDGAEDKQDDPDAEDPDDQTDPTNDDKGFMLQKNVAGEFADYEYQFEFAVNVQRPALSEKETYTAVKINVEDPTEVIETYTFNAETGEPDKDVTLAAGERLVFKDLEVGAKWTVAEENVPDNYTVTDTGNLAGTVVNTKGNSVQVTNTYNDEENTPTGILMQNAPYILVATLAAGGLVIYLAKRREEEEEA